MIFIQLDGEKKLEIVWEFLDPRIEKCGFPKWWNQWIFSGNHLHVEI
jgi:hypothetical protein